jgi:hypothetical protein
MLAASSEGTDQFEQSGAALPGLGDAEPLGSFALALYTPVRVKVGTSSFPTLMSFDPFRKLLIRAIKVFFRLCERFWFMLYPIRDSLIVP